MNNVNEYGHSQAEGEWNSAVPATSRAEGVYFDMNSDGWQKGFTNVPPGALRDSANCNVKNGF